jgi:heme exporter protein B
MTAAATFARQVRCLVGKDVRRERRARATWPAALLLGFLLVLTLELQADLPVEMKQKLVGGLLWLAVFFAGALGLERSFADENDAGCWDALRMYPVSPAAVYIAKFVLNFTTLSGVAALLIPLLVVLADAPLLVHPAAMLFVAVLANLGLAAIGTLVGGLVNGVRRRANLIVLLLLPLILPVLLGAGEATRLLILDDLGKDFWRWIQLLAAFAVMFFTASVMVFEYVMED